MSVTAKEIREALETSDAVILHFVHPDKEKFPKEYILIIDDDEDLEDIMEPIPDYVLTRAVPIDSSGDLDPLPMYEPLGRIC